MGAGLPPYAFLPAISTADVSYVNSEIVILLPKMLRRLLSGKPLQASGTTMEDQARIFRQGKGRSQSQSSWRTSPARARQPSYGTDNFTNRSPSFGTLTTSDVKKNVTIGFFLHTPFPSSEIYRFAAFARSACSMLIIKML